MPLSRLVRAALLILVSSVSLFSQDMPTLVTKVVPRYPEMSVSLGVIGTVRVRVLVNEKGDASSEIVQSSLLCPETGASEKNCRSGFDWVYAAALDTARKWKFRPDGKTHKYDHVFGFRLRHFVDREHCCDGNHSLRPVSSEEEKRFNDVDTLVEAEEACSCSTAGIREFCVGRI